MERQTETDGRRDSGGGALGVLALVCGFGAAVLGRLDRIAALLSARPVEVPRERAEPKL